MKRQKLYNPKRDRGKRKYWSCKCGNIGATNVGEYSGRSLFLLIPTIGKEDTPSDFGFLIEYLALNSFFQYRIFPIKMTGFIHPMKNILRWFRHVIPGFSKQQSSICLFLSILFRQRPSRPTV